MALPGFPKKMVCVDNSGYHYQLTVGKEYEILDKEPGIFSGRDYYTFVDDNGKLSCSHLYRFRDRSGPDRSS